MNFDEHTNALVTKISRSLEVLCKLRHLLPKPALHNLYYSMIHPDLLYGITVWENAFDKHLKRLDESLPANPVNDRPKANAVTLKSAFCLL